MLVGMANTYREIERLRDGMTSRNKVMTEEPLRVYESACARVKGELRARETIKERFNKKQTALDKVIITESNNRAKIVGSQIFLMHVESISDGSAGSIAGGAKHDHAAG